MIDPIIQGELGHLLLPGEYHTIRNNLIGNWVAYAVLAVSGYFQQAKSCGSKLLRAASHFVPMLY